MFHQDLVGHSLVPLCFDKQDSTGDAEAVNLLQSQVVTVFLDFLPGSAVEHGPCAHFNPITELSVFGIGGAGGSENVIACPPYEG